MADKFASLLRRAALASDEMRIGELLPGVHDDGFIRDGYIGEKPLDRYVNFRAVVDRWEKRGHLQYTKMDGLFPSWEFRFDRAAIVSAYPEFFSAGGAWHGGRVGETAGKFLDQLVDRSSVSSAVPLPEDVAKTPDPLGEELRALTRLAGQKSDPDYSIVVTLLSERNRALREIEEKNRVLEEEKSALRAEIAELSKVNAVFGIRLSSQFEIKGMQEFIKILGTLLLGTAVAVFSLQASVILGISGCVMIVIGIWGGRHRE